MSRHPQLYQWIDTVVMRFPSLSKPQALGLALWSFGMVHCPLVQVNRSGRCVGTAHGAVIQHLARKVARYLPGSGRESWKTARRTRCHRVLGSVVGVAIGWLVESTDSDCHGCDEFRGSFCGTGY